MSQTDHPLLRAIEPIAKLVDAEIVEPAAMENGDVPLEWEGTVIAGFRISSLHNALDRLVASIEQELDGSLADLDRVDKQRAVRLLDEKGAFLLRGAIEDVAEAMAVSRITIYNYLNTIRGDGTAGAD